MPGEWRATADGMTAVANYLSTHQYEVVVTLADGREKRKTIPATYEPRFGVDVDDIAAISEAAEELATQLEQERPE